MKLLKRIMLNIFLFLLGSTCTITYSCFVKNVETNGIIQGKIITASELSYEKINGTDITVQSAIDELYGNL